MVITYFNTSFKIFMYKIFLFKLSHGCQLRCHDKALRKCTSPGARQGKEKEKDVQVGC